MSWIKKISSFFLFLPLLFVIFSFFSQKAYAADYNLNVLVKLDNDRNQKYGNTASDPCYDGAFTVQVTDVDGTRTVGPFGSKPDCGNSVHSIKIHLIPQTSGTIGHTSYIVKLITPGKTLNYIDGYYNSNNTHIQLNRTQSASRSITMNAGDNQVAFGLATYNLNVMYALIDKDGDYQRDLGTNEEICYVGGLTLKEGDQTKNWNIRRQDCTGKYSSRRFDFATPVELSLPSNALYEIEGLKYSDDSTNHEVKKLEGRKSAEVRGDGSVYYFLKAKPPGGDSGCNSRKASLIPDKLSKSGKPGQTVTWEIKIKNEDTGTNCSDRRVDLSKSITNNGNGAWRGSFDKESIKLSKGETKTVKLSVTSPQSAKPGNSKTIVVKEKMEGHEASTKNITYEIISGDHHPTNPPTKKPTEPPASCTREKPKLTVSSDKRSAKPGGKITYTIKVKNMDHGHCNKRNLKLTRKLPNDNWTASFQPSNTFEISKGVEKTFTLPVTSPQSATPGTKEIGLSLLNSSGETLVTKSLDYVVSSETATSTPTNTTTPTNTPTPKPTNTSTPTPVPTASPTPSPLFTFLKLTIGVDGIGITPRIPTGGNKNPNNPNRNLTVRLFNASNNQAADIFDNWTFNYNSSLGKFQSTLDFTDSFASGIYNIYVTGRPFLTTQYPGSVNITKGGTVNLNSNNFYLITGNINNTDQSENKIDLLDYNVLFSCSIYSQDKSACNKDASYIKYSDLNDDGTVNEDDYTLFLKELANQQGVILPSQ